MQLLAPPPAVTGLLFMAATFGEWLRNERLKRNLTLEALAERTGGELTHVAIGDWERGKREPKKANLRLVCAALLGEDADQEEIDYLFWRGWAALGSSDGQTMSYIPASGSQVQILDAFDDLELDIQPAMLAAIQAAGKAKRSQRTDIIGKRPIED